MHTTNKFSSPMYEGAKYQFAAVSIPKRVETQGKIVHGMMKKERQVCKGPK